MSFTNEGEKQQYYINKCKEIIKAKEAALGRKLTASISSERKSERTFKWWFDGFSCIK